MFNKIKSVFQHDSAAISAANALPTAYRDMLGLDFMVCNDTSHMDFTGMGDPVALAEVKSANNETGHFNFFFVIQHEGEDTFDRFKCGMSVKQVGDSFLFTTAGEEVEVSSSVTAENLKPVLLMALRHKKQVPLQD